MRDFRHNSGSAYGGGFAFGPGGISPFIKWMIVINLVVFIFQNIYPQLTGLLGLTPRTFFTEMPNQLFQPFTYMFLHGSFSHIFFNMFALWMFGTEVERTFGSRSFGRFYLLAGLAGAVLTLIVKFNQTVPMVGASAAIYGVLAAYWMMFPNRLLYVMFLFPVPVKYAIPGLMLLGFLFGGPNVAHFAHLGGALFGLVFMKAEWRIPSLGRRFRHYRYERKAAKLEKRRERAEEVMKRVDQILDKINEVGLENLTREERKFLEEASSRLSEEKADD